MKIPKIIAHRGASGTAPENTIAAFSRAADMGVKAIELDANITSDGVVVVIHDETVDRCSSGAGAVAEKTFSQIRELDAGSWFGDEFE
ncbi:MAG: glycerophosphodiester phosphodiesterase family protein, partial [Rhodospirillaceae bacterium]|nr:glycerophosphodiester phosphodiesterase family protein [Rhodospirillaceae bacterium]